jgi:hypothetical protein
LWGLRECPSQAVCQVVLVFTEKVEYALNCLPVEQQFWHFVT